MLPAGPRHTRGTPRGCYHAIDTVLLLPRDYYGFDLFFWLRSFLWNGLGFRLMPPILVQKKRSSNFLRVLRTGVSYSITYQTAQLQLLSALLVTYLCQWSLAGWNKPPIPSLFILALLQ
jgi:hypothetical protein